MLPHGRDQRPSLLGGLLLRLGQPLRAVHDLLIGLVGAQPGGPALLLGVLGTPGEFRHVLDGPPSGGRRLVRVPAQDRFRGSLGPGNVEPGRRGTLRHAVLDVVQRLLSRREPVARGGEPSQGPGVCFGRRPPVGLGPGQLSGRTGGVARRPVECLGVAHLGPGAQRGVLGGQPRGPFTECGAPRTGLLAVRQSLVPIRLCLGEFPLEVLVAGVLAAGQAGAAPGGEAGVAPVVVEERRGRLLGLSGRPQFRLLLVQRSERLRRVGDDRLVHRRQRLGQRPGQGSFIGALGQLRLAQLDQEVDEGPVAPLPEPEEGFVDRPAVRLRRVVHHAVTADRLGEPVPGQSRAGGVQQVQAGADPLVRHREPVAGDAASGDRFQPAQQRTEMRLARGVVEPSELDPGVAEPFRVRVLAAQEQVPLHPLARVAVGLDAAGGEVTVQ